MRGHIYFYMYAYVCMYIYIYIHIEVTIHARNALIKTELSKCRQVLRTSSISFSWSFRSGGERQLNKTRHIIGVTYCDNIINNRLHNHQCHDHDDNDDDDDEEEGGDDDDHHQHHHNHADRETRNDENNHDSHHIRHDHH